VLIWDFIPMIHKKHTLPWGEVNLLLLGKSDQAGFDNSIDSYKKLVNEHSGIPENNIYLLNQVHGGLVLDADSYSGDETRDADGLFTASRGKVLVIKTGDCMPVFLWSGTRPLVAAIHAGWRGMTAEITENFIQQYPDIWQAYAGPCISMEQYEVESDVTSKFLQGDPGVALSDKPGKYHFGLVEHLHDSLEKKYNVELEYSGICTKESGDWFSHRGGDSGRNLNCIWIE